MKSQTYTTGAWIKPKKVLQSDGTHKWQWVVCWFDCDCFHNKEQTILQSDPCVDSANLIIKDKEITDEQ